MNESSDQGLKALARRDGQRAVSLVIRLLAHEVRNAMNPLSMQLAILRRQVRPGDDDLQDVLQGIREAIGHTNRVLDGIARLGLEIAPADSDDSELRELREELREWL